MEALKAGGGALTQRKYFPRRQYLPLHSNLSCALKLNYFSYINKTRSFYLDSRSARGTHFLRTNQYDFRAFQLCNHTMQAKLHIRSDPFDVTGQSAGSLSQAVRPQHTPHPGDHLHGSCVHKTAFWGGLRSEVTSKVSRRWMRLRAAAILQRRGRHPNAPKDLSGTCGETAGRSKSLKGFHGLESVIREGV